MRVSISADDPAIKAYHERLKAARQGADTQHEGNIRHAFANLLEATAKARDWTLVQEYSVRVDSAGGHLVRYDGLLRDDVNLPHGHWEAKDSDDNLEREISRKRDKGYSFKNIIFEDTQEAVLYQRGDLVKRVTVDDADGLAALLTRFYNHQIKPFDDFNAALDFFQQEIPEIATDLKGKIEAAHRDNRAFKAAFGDFMALCQRALNPNIRKEAVDEMLIQHLLTERLIRRVFDVETFVQRNVIAAEIETVIAALSSQHFNRAAFLGSLDHIYRAIEAAADEVETFAEKQAFLNTVYERFFQGYSVKVADTHGIVYTPQEIVDFMSAAVEEVLMDEFGLHLGDEQVQIIDPATGTGNFIVNLLNRVDVRDLDRFYREQLYANEVMLMPYYIASLNIEHAYYARSGRYEAFEGISFVDTLDLAEQRQKAFEFFTEKNTERVERQKAAAINVIIGNPPYNVGQLNENDNNKNRAYEIVDGRVRETYSTDSTASNKNALSDPYVKFFRWATDRLGGRDGVVCYVTNNSFTEGIAFDGMRKHLMQDFHRVYHLDLHGNVRLNPKISGTTHNVFGIQVGVGVTVAVRSSRHQDHRLYYHRVPEMWTAAEKLAMLAEHVEKQGRHNALNTITWEQLTPDKKHTWLVAEHTAEFESFISMGDKEKKAADKQNVEAVFKTYSIGIQTSRDSWVYDFSRENLAHNVKRMLGTYHSEMDRWLTAGSPGNVDDFLNNDETQIKWSSTLKRKLKGQQRTTFDTGKIRTSLYRPFTRQYTYFDDIMIHRPGQFPRFFPTQETEAENRVICVTDKGSEKSFMVMMSQHIPDLHLVGAGASAQSFPFYEYDEDGSNRRENITDWSLAQFRAHYEDETIEKWDIFYYVYGLLHHPDYRERYADNLKKSLPRIPFAPDFRAFERAGRDLAELHLNYEDVTPYRLTWEVTTDSDGQDKPLDYRVEKMRFKGKVKDSDTPYKVYTRLEVNESLTLDDIPAAAFAYRLGNRSALEWVVDRYRVKTDKRSGITWDPNQYGEDDRYIVDLVEKVIQVSVETVRIVESLALNLERADA